MSESLRREVDELRLENQELRAELRRRDLQGRGAWALMVQSALEATRNVRLRVDGLRGSILPASDGPGPGQRPPPPTDPYRARIREPLERERPRILHVVANFYTGGSAQLIVDLFERLGHRYEQEVVTRDLPPTPAYAGIPVFLVPRVEGGRFQRDHLRRFAPDLAHVHYLGHHRNAYSARDWEWYHDIFAALQHSGTPAIENVNIPVPPYVSAVVSRYVYVSEYVRERFGRLDSPGATIYPGSDLSLFSRESVADTPEDCIGMVYRLEGDKLDERSIDVFVEVVRRRPQTRGLIVGGGRFLDLYRSKVREAGLQGAFTFTGYVGYSELPAYLAQMSVFVAPVHTESFGQVSPFAMGMALPVAGYRVGALSEILGTDELLATPGDVDALADIIVNLLEDRSRAGRVGRQNQERARKEFSVETMVRRYETLYEETLESVPAGSR